MYASVNMGFNLLRIGGLMMLEVSDCEQRGCFHRLLIMSLLWLQVQTANNGGVFTGCTL